MIFDFVTNKIFKKLLDGVLPAGDSKKLGGKSASEYVSKDSGGIVSNGTEIPLGVNNPNGWNSLFRYSNTAGGGLIGFQGSTPIVANDDFSAVNALIHNGNVGDFALPKDGTAVKAEALPMGTSFPNGLVDKPYTLVAQYKANEAINTKAVFLISNYFAVQRSGILEVTCRWDNGTTPTFLYNMWTVCNGIDDPNMFIATYSCENNYSDGVIKLYIKTTGWTSYNVTKLAEHNWGNPVNKWEMIKSYNNENAVASIPSTETQVPSTIAVLSNPVANAFPISGGVISNADQTPVTVQNTIEGAKNAFIRYRGQYFDVGCLGFADTNVPAFIANDGSYWHKLFHTGNKPTGTYTGNGSATSRTISTGGLGNIVAIVGNNGAFSIISNANALCSASSGAINTLAFEKIHAVDGVITMATDDARVNASGVTYTYYHL